VVTSVAASPHTTFFLYFSSFGGTSAWSTIHRADPGLGLFKDKLAPAPGRIVHIVWLAPHDGL
jgi:hypothetical protein